MSRHPRGPSSAPSGSSRSRLHAVYDFLPSSRPGHSRQASRDPNWQIDDGDVEGEWRPNGHSKQPSASSSRSTVPMTLSSPPYFQPQIEEDEDETEDHGYFPVPNHGRSVSAASDSALLLQSERSHPKSLWDRIVRYTDGLRKSPSYRSGRVRPLRAVDRPPLNLDSNSPVEMLSPPSKSTLGGSSFGGAPGAMTASTSTLPSVPARTYTAAPDAKDANGPVARAAELDEHGVLLISRVPGQDFATDESATTTEHSEAFR